MPTRFPSPLIKPDVSNHVLKNPVRGSLPASAVQGIFAGRSGELQPGEVVVRVQCGIHKRPFLILFCKADGETWRAVASAATADIPASDRRAGCDVDTADRVIVTGSIVIAADFPGCSYCGSDGLVACTCGAFNCKGLRCRQN